MGAKHSFKGGLNLHFFADSADETNSNWSHNTYKAHVRNALSLLMMGWNTSWSKLVNLELLRAVFLERNPELLKEFRFAFQEGFNHLFTQFQGKQFTPQQHEQIQLYLSNCLSILPMGDITPYESISIPQYIDEQWVMVEYFVKPIELTDHNGKDELIYKDYDRVFAYGLEPINHLKAQPHLIFMGTTYPAGQGFLPQVTTDMKGFETVGYSLYVTGRQRILEWVLSQHAKIHVCGVSLGGSLSLLFANDLGNYATRVDALNPAGLHDTNSRVPYDGWDTLTQKPIVVIQQQGNDFVSSFGVWKKDWVLLHVNPPANKRGPSSYFDHFLNYAAFADTEFTSLSPELQNESRKFRNFWLYSLGRGAVYYFAIAPYSYGFRPFKNHVFGNWLNLGLSMLFACSIIVLLGAAIWAALPTLVIVAISASLALICGLVGCAFGITTFTRNNRHLDIRDKQLEDANKYPDATELNLAKLHYPSAPRNPELDIYKHEISFDLTYKEINTYYKVMRTMVKGKRFIPPEDKPEYCWNGLTKREVLLYSSNQGASDETLTLKTSKAKFMFIRHALNLIDRISTENEDKLKEALQHEYNHYRLGKA
ncbi:hypothetical protein [Legionella waltersii]|uniref:Uncharacterized protein n=1 Tax=Legionella waltersii TaxID=66969 RepID=A0A0W1AMA9_9GAMM|nr:hypothetical protein [Legionella waltersii]KTD82507.1 hypothetical protein Lwal_0624 [Legionella waltersii]SNV02953.1 Uncharacterised protein [Legionella waltersii]